MTSSDARYRLDLAQGFLAETEDHLENGSFRAAVDTSQLCVENAIKAVASLFGPVPKTHEPREMLEEIAGQVKLKRGEKQVLARLTVLGEVLGFELHVRVDYGDEASRTTPWMLYQKKDATEAVSIAKEALRIARGIVEGRLK
ncbi:MAG: HEPN domain-containing protein [Deltaproteobacteria bacterium]|nr:HEPN domain-containing protein [Deltaproteobacteria bacterium]